MTAPEPSRLHIEFISVSDIDLMDDPDIVDGWTFVEHDPAINYTTFGREVE